VAEADNPTPESRPLECPAELRELQGWLVWRSEQFPNETKPRKVPYYVDGHRRQGKQGSPEDRSRLVTFGAARDAAKQRGYEGVGLALLPDWGITALDFDHCVDANGNLPKEVQDVVSRTFAEYSPSGKGVRAFVRGSLGNHKSHLDATNDYGMEVFNTNGFVTLTGNLLPFTELLGLENTIAPVDDNLTALCKKRFGATQGSIASTDPFDTFEPPLNLTRDEIEAHLSDLNPSMGRDPWIQVGMALSHESSNSDEGFDLWNEWSANGVQYPGPEALRTQWDSFARRDVTGRQITMRTVLKMSKEARGKRGEPPRSVDLIARAAEAAAMSVTDINPDRMQSSPGFTGKYRVYGAGEFSNRPPIRWLIKGVLPRDAEIGVIYGAPGSGKSFQAIDMGLSLARGVPWRERKVVKSRVLYIAAEGGAGVSQRLKAYSIHTGVNVEDIPFGVINDAPNLMIEEDSTELVKAIVDVGGADLIICDTWAQVTPGANENSGEDMGLALKHARSIRAATGAMILLVAHTGKDQAKGIRGWSGMNAAANTSLEVSRVEESDVRLLQVTKQKDGRDDIAPWAFRLEEVLIGYDEDDEEIMTPVIVECEAPVIAPKPKADRRGGNAYDRLVLDHIPLVPNAPRRFPVDQLINLIRDGYPGEAEAPSEGSLRRAIEALGRGRNPAFYVINGMVELPPGA
jgi:hypothetical protein